MGMRNLTRCFLAILLFIAGPVYSDDDDQGAVDRVAVPNVQPGFKVNIFAKEPYFINPSALAAWLMKRPTSK